MAIDISSDKTELEIMVDEMVAGNVSPREVQTRIFENDQNSADRNGAEENLRLLQRPDAKAFFESRRDVPGMYEGYLKTLSLAAFHVAQRMAIEGSSEALQKFKIAFESASGVSDTKYKEWVNYVEGTLAYIQNDLAKLNEVKERLVDSVNKHLLKKYSEALDKFGSPDYKRDYR